MKKYKFLTLKRKSVFVCLLCILLVCVSFGTYFTVRAVTTPKLAYTIVIDAGHGGKDGGAVGTSTGVTESFLNLQYAFALQKLCAEFGFKVVLTRSDMNGLYSDLAENKKKSEMAKRKKIIEKSNADLVISLHMNSFPLSSVRGSQVFYGQDNAAGQALAESIASSLSQNIAYAKKTAKVGDYFVLNCTKLPAVLVECGYLSNHDEEILLQDEEYIHNFCYLVLCGILQYFRM
jgi:N-acetylmuramoyl-L-alanine amidase